MEGFILVWDHHFPYQLYVTGPERVRQFHLLKGTATEREVRVIILDIHSFRIRMIKPRHFPFYVL